MSNPQQGSRIRRPLGAALLLAALALAILAGSALAAALVKNGSFERDSNKDGIPNSWSATTGIGPSDKRVCNQAYAGSCSFKMIGEGSTNDKWIWQEPAVSGEAGDTYKLTLWVKSKDIVWGGGNATIYLELFYTGGGDDFDSEEIPEGTSAGWVKYTLSVTATEAYDGARVLIDFEPDGGKAWFDKVKLVGP